MKKELILGDTFTDDNVKLEVVEQENCNCKGCYYEGNFYTGNRPCYPKRYFICSSVYRKDHKDVIFKQIDKDSKSEETAQKLNIDFNNIKNDMKTKEIRIKVPEGMEIDEEDSDLKNGKIAFKKKKQEIKTWRDLIGFDIPIGSALMVEKVENPFSYSFFTSDDRSVFIDEKHAKSALAMAMISQLMPFYGGSITDEEWNNSQINKYTICRKEDYASFVNSPYYEFLAFHTREQREEFFYNNGQLVNDYLMIAGQ